MATCVGMGFTVAGKRGVIGGLWEVAGVEMHPVVGVFVGWGCAMVSRSVHIPKP